MFSFFLCVLYYFTTRTWVSLFMSGRGRAEQGHTIKDLRRRLRTVENVYKDTLRHYSACRLPLNQLLHFLPIDEILELDLLDGRVNRVERKRSV